MNLLRLLSSARDRRNAPRRRRVASIGRQAEGLERREVFAAGLAAAYVAAAAPAPSSAQAGTSLGLAWRFAPAGDAAGDGTLYIQSVAKGTDTLDRTNSPIWVNQQNGHMILDVDWSQQFQAASVKPTAKVNVVVGMNSGTDIDVKDDRGPGMISYEARTQSGRVDVQDGRYLTWTFEQNVVTQQATFTLNSGKTDTARYNLQGETNHARPGEPGYGSKAIVGITVSDRQGNSGGVSFDPGMKVKIVTTGGASYLNTTGFNLTHQA